MAKAATKKAKLKAEAAEEVVPKKKRGKKEDAAESEVIPAFNPYAHLDAEIDATEKRFKLTSMAFDKDEPRFSTGLVTLDVMLGGGLLGGGWYTCFGGEQSCKSTTAMTILSSIVAQEDFKGVASYHDYEGSSQPDYVENIMNAMGLDKKIDNVFGVRDTETNEWIVKPRVRYYQPDNGEKFFHYMAKLEKTLPDKLKIGDHWYVVYDNTKENQKALKGYYDTKYLTKHGKLRIRVEDGSPQAILLVDSYPAMLPERADDKEEGDASLALQARMFSDHIKRVKPAMKRKRIIVLGVNQLRKVPMAMYGPTETEPCGEALKFYSDVRLRMSSVSIPHGKGMIEEEESVIADGDDRYRYIKIRTHKNKLGGIPNQETTMRIVVENAKGKATGFCRTWDTYQYLKLTGQIGGNRKKIKFLESMTTIETDSRGVEKPVEIKFKHPLVGQTVSWMDFKVLVEGDKSDIKHLCTTLGIKPFLLRKFVQKQVGDGEGYRYAVAYKRAQAAGSKAATSDEDDEE